MVHDHTGKGTVKPYRKTNIWRESDESRGFRGWNERFQGRAVIAVPAVRYIIRHQPMRQQRRQGRTHVFHLRGCMRNQLGILAARQGTQPVGSAWDILIEVVLFMRLGSQIMTSQLDGCFSALHAFKAATSAQGNSLRRTSADTVVHGTAPRLRWDSQGMGQKRQMRHTE